MNDTPKRPAGPPRQASAPPVRPAAKPAELLPGEMKTRAPEQLNLARPQMHPIQRRPVIQNPADASPHPDPPPQARERGQ